MRKWQAPNTSFKSAVCSHNIAVTIKLLLLYTRLKAVLSRCEDVAKDQITRDHLVWAAGNGDPMHEVCIPHRIHRAWEQQG